MLFDCGYSGVFIDNAQRMGEDLAEIEHVIISHGHNDHTWGLTHLIQHFDTRKITLKTIIATFDYINEAFIYINASFVFINASSVYKNKACNYINGTCVYSLK